MRQFLLRSFCHFCWQLYVLEGEWRCFFEKWDVLDVHGEEAGRGQTCEVASEETTITVSEERVSPFGERAGRSRSRRSGRSMYYTRKNRPGCCSEMTTGKDWRARRRLGDGTSRKVIREGVGEGKGVVGV